MLTGMARGRHDVYTVKNKGVFPTKTKIKSLPDGYLSPEEDLVLSEKLEELRFPCTAVELVEWWEREAHHYISLPETYIFAVRKSIESKQLTTCIATESETLLWMKRRLLPRPDPVRNIDGAYRRSARMSVLTVTQALANWFGKPMAKLPRELRPIAEAYIKEWPLLSADERRARAAEVDRQRSVKAAIKLARGRRAHAQQESDSLQIATDTIEWWDDTMSASFWWSQPSITPYQAALILCRYDPNNANGADPEKDSTDETGPDDYARLASAFVAFERVKPAHRTLEEWFTYTKSRGLKYHTWIDEYMSVVATLASVEGLENFSLDHTAQLSQSISAAALAKESPSVSHSPGALKAGSTPAGDENWVLRTPNRFQGYRRAIYRVLKAAFDSGAKQAPKARDVLDALSLSKPLDIAEVTPEELKYYGADGSIKIASLRDISKTIDRLVARASGSPSLPDSPG